ncbi:MAG TPA: tetratricopeptide repeat protein [Terriglobales bacterium]|nr:tetratricopeptide repeat protein [Terriglobales bacterium]
MLPAELQKIDAALAALDSPSDAAGWSEKGRLLARLERNTSALAAFDRALDLDPALASAWMRKALLLEELDRIDQALAAYAGLLAHDPAHVPAWSNQAGLLMRAGRFPEALNSLDQALAADPENHLLILNKGLLLLQAFERPAEALPWLERALPSGLPEAAEAVAICQSMLQDMLSE